MRRIGGWWGWCWRRWAGTKRPQRRITNPNDQTRNSTEDREGRKGDGPRGATVPTSAGPTCPDVGTMTSDAPSLDGDYGFRGVEMRLEPATLAAGWVAAAQELPVSPGKAETRPGIVKLKWTHHAGSAFPSCSTCRSMRRCRLWRCSGRGGSMIRTGWNGSSSRAAGRMGSGKVWVTRPNNGLIEEPLPRGGGTPETIDGPCSVCAGGG
jgi:hypothetical protein